MQKELYTKGKRLLASAHLATRYENMLEKNLKMGIILLR